MNFPSKFQECREKAELGRVGKRVQGGALEGTTIYLPA